MCQNGLLHTLLSCRKQKEVIRLEAMELDVEMAMIQNDSKVKLQQQVHVHVHVCMYTIEHVNVRVCTLI